jgi:hypothetical protein
MTFNVQFLKIYKRNASLVGIHSVTTSGKYTYYYDIVTYFGKWYVSIMRKIALLFNYKLHQFGDYDPNHEHWKEDENSKPGVISYIFTHVEDIDHKNSRELVNRKRDQMNAKKWYDSYLKSCEQNKFKSQKRHVHFEENYSDDDDWDQLDTDEWQHLDDDPNFDPEENLDY